MKTKYIVTGGAGFIGAAIAKKLIELGSEVYILDNLSTGRKGNIPSGAKFIHFDISDDSEYSKLDDIVVDAVLHLAAQSSGESSFDDPIYDMEVNVKGTLCLLEWCRKKNIKRFIEASSIMVYGEAVELPLVEDVRCYPRSFYAVGKLATEQYLELYAEKGDVNYTVFRMGNVFGEGQDLSNLKQGMVSIYLAYLLGGKKIIVRGRKDRFRDFIYIDDVVDFWIAAIGNEKSFNKVYNLGVGKGVTVETLINQMYDIISVQDSERLVEYQEEGTPGDVLGNYCDLTKLIKDFGFNPKYKLKNGLEKTINCYRQEMTSS